MVVCSCNSGEDSIPTSALIAFIKSEVFVFLPNCIPFTGAAVTTGLSDAL